VKIVTALAAVSILALAGCASADLAEEHAQDAAAAQCADQGKAFVQTGGTAASNGVVAGATAQGQCAGPGDTVAPPPPTQ
jgi:hypothetical protein